MSAPSPSPHIRPNGASEAPLSPDHTQGCLLSSGLLPPSRRAQSVSPGRVRDPDCGHPHQTLASPGNVVQWLAREGKTSGAVSMLPPEILTRQENSP